MASLLDVSESDLPAFQDPPVIETVLGLQFDPIASLKNAHLGAFWSTLGADWTNVADSAPLDDQFERFDAEPTWIEQGVRLQFSRKPLLRLQIRNVARDRMIQIQNGRFHLNWLKRPGAEYPRYSRLRPQFDTLFKSFEDYVRDTSSERIRPNQWEVTYVNYIDKGAAWSQPRDWSDLLPFHGPAIPTREGMALETFSGEWQYEIKPRLGRLHVEIKHGRRSSSPSEQVEALVVKLTARGPLTDSVPTVQKGLDLGRKAIVLAFRDFTSAEAHATWRPK